MTQAIQNLNITHDLTIAPAVEQLELHLDNLNDTVVENYIEEIEDDLADFGGNHPIVGNDLDLRNDSIWRLYVVRVFWLIIMVLFWNGHQHHHRRPSRLAGRDCYLGRIPACYSPEPLPFWKARWHSS